jgi:hypothetical protein
MQYDEFLSGDRSQKGLRMDHKVPRRVHKVPQRKFTKICELPEVPAAVPCLAVEEQRGLRQVNLYSDRAIFFLSNAGIKKR